MSRVGKQPVALPEGVDVNVTNNTILVKGKKGELKNNLPETVKVVKEDDKIIVAPIDDSKSSKSAWGLIRTIINNMIVGVEEGFTKSLVVNGVGYRAAVGDGILTLQLGYSHDINFDIPEGIKIGVEKQTILKISGSDKQLVGVVASKIKTLRKIEPYKGKGVREKGQYILKKEGKKK